MATTELKDKVLQECEDRIESQLAPENRDNYMKIVVSGMHVAMDKGPHGMLGALKTSKDPISSVAKGAVGLVFGMKKMSKGNMPTKALIPAAMTLMLKGLDFINNAGIAKIGTEELVRATKIFTDTITRIYKITPQMIKHGAGKVHELTNDPQAVEKMKLAAGVTQHPMAPKPTPMPEDNGVANGSA